MNSFSKNLLLWAAISLVMVVLFNLFNQPQAPKFKLTYTEFLDKVKSGEVMSVKIQGPKIAGRLISDQMFST